MAAAGGLSVTSPRQAPGGWYRRLWRAFEGSSSYERLADTLPAYRIELEKMVAGHPDVARQPANVRTSLADHMACFADQVRANPPGPRADPSTGAEGAVPGQSPGPYVVPDESTREPPRSCEWARAALLHLGQAEQALRDNDPDLGWRSFKAATRDELSGLATQSSQDAYEARLNALYQEAMIKLDGWRKATVVENLETGGKTRATVAPDKAAAAAEILHGHQDNLYHKLSVTKARLQLLSVIALVIAVVWIAWAPDVGTWLTVEPANTSSGAHAIARATGQFPGGTRGFLVAASLFGIMGALFSGLISTWSGGDNTRIPEHLLAGWVTLSRLAIGAMSAIAMIVLVMADVINLGSASPGLALVAALAAGFSERLIRQGIEAVSG